MNQSEYKIRNLESSILYLQEEHANTLKLLHEEIKELQMKNSELSFQVAMQNIGVSKDLGAEAQQRNSVLLNEIKKLEEQVSYLNSQNESKTKQLEINETNMNMLSTDIDKLNQTHKDRVTEMEIELNNKSAEIVLLSTKLHNWKKLEIKSSNLSEYENHIKSTSKPFLVPQAPFASKIFKLRNQISVHPDDNHLRGRPIIARHTMISTAHPTKSKIVHPIPECALSTEERSSFSKSIKRPNILPPINSKKTDLRFEKSPAFTRNSSSNNESVYLRDSCIDSFNRSCMTHHYDFVDNDDSSDTNDVENVNSVKPELKLVQIDIDKVIDINNSTMLSTNPSFSCPLYRNHSS